MNKNKKNFKKIKEQEMINANFINFTIKREDWNLYKLEDGSLLRARVILSGVLADDLKKIEENIKEGKKPELKLRFRSNRIFAVESPPELRGPPDFNRYTTEELRSFVVKEDLDFETIKEVWNVYELENGIIIKLRLSPINISKTSKFDSGGMPLYLIDANVEGKIQLPETLRKLLKEKTLVKQRLPKK